VCVDGEASETDDEEEKPTKRIVMQSSYREDICVDGEASETDDEEENGVVSMPKVFNTDRTRLDTSEIKIIERIEDEILFVNFVSLYHGCINCLKDDNSLQTRRKHLVEIRKLEKEIDRRFGALQRSGTSIRQATDSLLSIDVLFDNLSKKCDDVMKNR
ncbi:hypothetical protein PFISCL1PPCAC_18889, partial [Pristionchus fissidentatus]